MLKFPSVVVQTVFCLYRDGVGRGIGLGQRMFRAYRLHREEERIIVLSIYEVVSDRNPHPDLLALNFADNRATRADFSR